MITRLLMLFFLFIAHPWGYAADPVNPDEVLVIVDMQKRFIAAGDEELQYQIVRKIEQAKDGNQLILVLEYKNHGETFELILEALKKEDYPYYYILEKEEDSGAEEVVSWGQFMYVYQINGPWAFKSFDFKSFYSPSSLWLLPFSNFSVW